MEGLEKALEELEGIGIGGLKGVEECVKIMRVWCEVGKEKVEGETKGGDVKGGRRKKSLWPEKLHW